jgi:hypothetical protein
MRRRPSAQISAQNGRSAFAGFLAAQRKAKCLSILSFDLGSHPISMVFVPFNLDEVVRCTAWIQQF